MYELMVRTRFAAAHFLTDYMGPCARLHGHTWHVEVTLKGHELDNKGMLIDFKEIKAAIKNIVDGLDHRHLNELEPFRSGGRQNPTAENLSRYIYRKIQQELEQPQRDLKIEKVVVWESPDAYAAYCEVD